VSAPVSANREVPLGALNEVLRQFAGVVLVVATDDGQGTERKPTTIRLEPADQHPMSEAPRRFVAGIDYSADALATTWDRAYEAGVDGTLAAVTKLLAEMREPIRPSANVLHARVMAMRNELVAAGKSGATRAETVTLGPALCGAKRYTDPSYHLPDVIDVCNRLENHDGNHEVWKDGKVVCAWKRTGAVPLTASEKLHRFELCAHDRQRIHCLACRDPGLSLAGEILSLVSDSRDGYHDSTLWDDEATSGEWRGNIAARWREVRERFIKLRDEKRVGQASVPAEGASVPVSPAPIAINQRVIVLDGMSEGEHGRVLAPADPMPHSGERAWRVDLDNHRDRVIRESWLVAEVAVHIPEPTAERPAGVANPPSSKVHTYEIDTDDVGELEGHDGVALFGIFPDDVSYQTLLMSDDTALQLSERLHGIVLKRGKQLVPPFAPWDNVASDALNQVKKRMKTERESLGDQDLSDLVKTDREVAMTAFRRISELTPHDSPAYIVAQEALAWLLPYDDELPRVRVVRGHTIKGKLGTLVRRDVVISSHVVRLDGETEPRDFDEGWIEILPAAAEGSATP
jgi:hypothetical protein